MGSRNKKKNLCKSTSPDVVMCRVKQKFSFLTQSDKNFLLLGVISLIFLLLCLTSNVSGVSSHRHRHGDILRRMSRESALPTPRVESYMNTRVTPGTHAAYKVDEPTIVQSTVGNEHKPNFTLCNSYRPQVFENQPINTSVIQVRAIDLDPVNSGGGITYSIVETTDDFLVDTHTGWVRTNKIFDRDEPAREKIAYVSVRATDNGRPQLDDVCNLQIKIVDINDNKPMFDKFAYGHGSRRKDYRESIPRDMAVGQVVMRISATDIDDGNNGSVQYRLTHFSGSPEDIKYFEVTPDTGEVRLKQKFPESRDSERTYLVVGVASDKGIPPETSTTNLSIRVLEPNQKPPFFIQEYLHPIRIKELNHQNSQPVAVLEASSGITNNTLVFFELVNGQTQATNKDSMFTSEASGNKVSIKVEKALDYELVNEYTLTIRVSNKHDLASTTVLKIEVEDENDERPFFTDVKQGSVLENEPTGTVVMRVQAIDKDGTSPNNLVSYSLGPEYSGDFSIDAITGEIKTNRPFNRELQDIYQLEVIAMDGAPSAILKPNPQGLPNERREQFKIEIADRNDSPPKFDETKGGYKAEIPENADIGNVVIEVKATDPDTESVIKYSIEEGDPDGNFNIKSTSQGGIISVHRSLDYESVQSYRLKVKASDSLMEDFTTVLISITNVNDNPPVFEDIINEVTIQEETIPENCIFTVRAYDPDISNRSQNIFYFVDRKAQELFSVDNSTGCVRVRKPLDRDPPHGVPFSQAFIGAFDENGNTTTKLSALIELRVNLIDINDNFPKLNSTNPVVWNENQGAGTITQLTAIDYDDDSNGAPFIYKLASNADPEIRNSFQVVGNTLRATKENFDREARKIYVVPIEISDSGFPTQRGVSNLTVIIGDLNDSPMNDGESRISVYKYKENNTVTIGRVFVEDLDDWDLPDKSFAWDGQQHNDFVLDYADGSIHMRASAIEGVHTLNFRVHDTFRNEEAKAIVTVTIKQIPEEAVDKSGSIRFQGLTKEEFVKPETPGGKTRLEKLRTEIARILGLPESNVDVFTVINPYSANDEKVVDVRFSAHGSPYYHAEKMEGLLAPYKDRLEALTGTKIIMIRVDECLREHVHCESSCVNTLTKNHISYKIFTNTSSFVGIDAFITPECKCLADFRPKSCHPNPCLYNGVCHAGPNIDGFRCECQEGYRGNGNRCEETSVSFQGNGYAWFSPISVCASSQFDVHFNTTYPNGLIFYNGPTHQVATGVSDFVSLELADGHPVFLLDYGTGVLQLEFPKSSPSLSDGKEHHISLNWNSIEISMSVDDCLGKNVKCYVYGQPVGSHSSLNVNGPLQLGGVSFKPSDLQLHMNWVQVPTSKGFIGCISNVTLNGEYYDLGHPSYAMGNLTSCDVPIAGVQVANLGVGLNFIIILIVCLLVLLLLLLALVFYRRSRKYEEVKGEAGDDVRENIINYSDEGGGEGDHAGYDLSVLMKAGNGPYVSPSDKIPMENFHPQGQIPPDNGPDMGSFLQGNKNRVDSDPDGLPFDDVRNYAYEGDGNSIGSLSSLASGTDDEDMNFDFLPNFGPRFKKLADMIGGESSDDERSPNPPDPWC